MTVNGRDTLSGPVDFTALMAAMTEIINRSLATRIMDLSVILNRLKRLGVVACCAKRNQAFDPGQQDVCTYHCII